MQVAVEIRVEPKPRAHRPTSFGRQSSGAASKDEPRPPIFDCGFEQWIPGEPTPRFQFWADAFFVAEKGNQIARLATVQHSDQLRQKTRGESLMPDIQLEVCPHRHGCILFEG